MIREDFLVAVRELAERLGAELWRIVERQTAEARAAALEVAIGRLRSQIAAGAPDPEPATAPAERRRAPRRCSSCRSLEHDARRCHGSEPQDPPSSAQVAADEPPPAAAPQDADPAPVDDASIANVADDTGTDDEPDDLASSSPPPTRADRFARIEAAARTRRAEGA